MTKSTYFSPLILSALLLALSSTVYAQTTTGNTGVAASRSDVRMDRDEFLKTHRYDDVNSDWIPKTSSKADYTRAEVKVAREQYLKTHRWDPVNDDFILISAGPRDMSAMSREEVKMEAMQFVRTHTWDNLSSKWVKKPMRAKK